MKKFASGFAVIVVLSFLPGVCWAEEQEKTYFKCVGTGSSNGQSTFLHVTVRRNSQSQFNIIADETFAFRSDGFVSRRYFGNSTGELDGSASGTLRFHLAAPFEGTELSLAMDMPAYRAKITPPGSSEYNLTCDDRRNQPEETTSLTWECAPIVNNGAKFTLTVMDSGANNPVWNGSVWVTRNVYMTFLRVTSEPASSRSFDFVVQREFDEPDDLYSFEATLYGGETAESIAMHLNPESGKLTGSLRMRESTLHDFQLEDLSIEALQCQKTDI